MIPLLPCTVYYLLLMLGLRVFVMFLLRECWLNTSQLTELNASVWFFFKLCQMMYRCGNEKKKYCVRKPCLKLSIDFFFFFWRAVMVSKTFKDSRQFFSVHVYMYYQLEYIALQGMFEAKKSSASVKAFIIGFCQLDVRLDMQARF